MKLAKALVRICVAIFFCLAVPNGAMAGDSEAESTLAALQQAVAGDHRSDRNKARDKYRHPARTLSFLGIRDDMTVVEIYPGGGAWYMEILAPFLKRKGVYHAAGFDHDAESDYARRSIRNFEKKLASAPEAYAKVQWTDFGSGKLDIPPDGAADMVLTFRNVHSFMSGNYADGVFAAMYRALKPGGILGVVEHRGPTDAEQDPKAGSGYVREDYAIKLIEKAGFEFVGGSDINNNPKDTKDYWRGVWTLPPTLALKVLNRDKYLAIGESDRFTLKFRKPPNG